MKKEIKQKIEDLSNLILANSGIYREYSDHDLVNATEIFMEVLFSKTYDHQSKNLSESQMGDVAEDFGKKIRKMILGFSGVDLREVYESKTYK